MTWNEAHTTANRLWTKWVSDKPHVSILTHGPDAVCAAYDLNRIHASMLHEHRFHRSGKSTATAGLMREVRGELVLLGKLRKILE